MHGRLLDQTLKSKLIGIILQPNEIVQFNTSVYIGNCYNKKLWDVTTQSALTHSASNTWMRLVIMQLSAFKNVLKFNFSGHREQLMPSL